MKVTFSQLDRLMACDRSAHGPHWPEDSGPAAERGTAIHAYLHNVSLHGRTKALALVPAAHRADCARIELDELPIGDAFRPEVAVAFNLETGEARELDVSHRAYPDLGRFWVYGTIDVVSDGVIYDYKTGQHGTHTWQLLAGSIAMALLNGTPAQSAAIIRLHEDGTHHQEQMHRWTSEQLVQARAELLERYRRWTECGAVEALPRPGEHCHYCPSWQSCPAKTELIRQVTVEDIHARALDTTVTEEDVAEAWQWVSEAQAAVTRVRDQIEAVVSMTGMKVPLPGGKVLGSYETTRKEWDGATVLDVLARAPLETLGGKPLGDLARHAVSFEASKASIERALDAANEAGMVPPRKFAAASREAQALIEAAGGVTTRTSTRVGVHTPKPDSVSTKSSFLTG